MANTEWLDKQEYPFKSHFFQTAVGKLHYVDEGTGEPIVFVHGNPSWSFEFRHLIKELSQNYRCIAVDHIGFGLSEKPFEYSYLPSDHGDNLEALLNSLILKDITLVMGDWGGPIGLSYAVKHPENIKNLVITNSWCWSVKKDWYYQAFSKFTGGSIGRYLIRKRNFFANTIVKMSFADKKKLTKAIHDHYLLPLADPNERKGDWILPKQIIAASDWLSSIWNTAENLKNKTILIAWGLKDIAFRVKELNQWIQKFPDARVVRYADAGHYLSEEKPTDFMAEIKNLMTN